MNLSYSRFSTYLSCPYSHYLAYEEGWVQKKVPRPLFFGRDFHRLLEYRNKPKEELEQVKQEITDTYYSLSGDVQSDLGEDYPQDLFTIFEDYCDVWKDTPLPTKTEIEFNIPMAKYKGEDIIFKGFIDELYETDEGFKVGEHKTFTRMPQKDFLVMNAQKSLYAKAVELLFGELPKTILWDYIHSQVASYPIWLDKSQRFSQANNSKITPYSWRRACAEKGITDEEIIKQGDNYSQNISNFFFRTEMDYIPEMVEQVWDGFKYTCKDIVKNGKKNKTKNISQNCSWCNYRDICHAELTGGNVEAIFEHDFERKDDGCISKKETT